ncbi:unnamed protein product [Rotaria sordida]|uniref:Uncharacterized protein n=1 Tax=Rotaria sordida TaxID=392033 RepID=A0A813YK72_9BILA|nr:unnamed protein product [Rotaria sordida]
MFDVILNRFCSCILPQIHYNIQSLLVEPSSIECILLTCDYLKLHKLTLNAIKPDMFIKYLACMKFVDIEIQLILVFITHLSIVTIEYDNTISQMNLNKNGYTHLFSVCQRLTHLNINGKYLHLNPWRQAHALPLTMCSSSIIIELNINVHTIDDCLRLLDGRSNQMKTLIVTVDSIEAPSLHIDNQDNLSNLTTFSFILRSPTENRQAIFIDNVT